MILTRDGKEITVIYRQDGSEVEEVKDANGRIVYSALREITGTLPLYFSGRGKPLTDYLISGNTVRDGTPSSQAPVDATGSGVRTGNVMPAGEKKTVENRGIIFSSDGKGKYTISGTATAAASVRFDLLSAFTTPISVSNGGQGTLSFFNTQSNNNVTFVFYNGATMVDDWKMTPSNRISTVYNAVGNKYVDSVMITVASGTTVDMTITPEFTDDGVLPSEFEPYGFKLHLTVNGAEYPIYFGTVPTTRRVEKLVLTGEETITSYTGYGAENCFFVSKSGVVAGAGLCNNYSNVSNLGDFIRTDNSFMNATNTVRIHDSRFASPDDLKSYLAAQYSSGTPVTIWYVLAEPETGIVNEPLMKIGDYADTVSFAQAGVTIPTVSGANVLDMTSPVKPSEVYIKGKGIKPTGYGQLTDANGVNILDKDGRPIYVHGQ